MRSVPRDIGADELVRRLKRLGYVKSKQEGSHISCVRQNGGNRRLIVPRHNPVKVGTLQDIIKRFSTHLSISEDEAMDLLEP